MHGILELSLQLLNSFSPANLGAYASPTSHRLLLWLKLTVTNYEQVDLGLKYLFKANRM